MGSLEGVPLALFAKILTSRTAKRGPIFTVVALYLNGLAINLMATSIVLAVGSCAVAYLTPASSLPGAILHGGAMVNPKDIYLWNCIMMAYEFILLMFVCIPIVLLGIGM